MQMNENGLVGCGYVETESVSPHTPARIGYPTAVLSVATLPRHTKSTFFSSSKRSQAGHVLASWPQPGNAVPGLWLSAVRGTDTNACVTEVCYIRSSTSLRGAGPAAWQRPEGGGAEGHPGREASLWCSLGPPTHEIHSTILLRHQLTLLLPVSPEPQQPSRRQPRRVGSSRLWLTAKRVHNTAPGAGAHVVVNPALQEHSVCQGNRGHLKYQCSNLECSSGYPENRTAYCKCRQRSKTLNHGKEKTASHSKPRRPFACGGSLGRPHGSQPCSSPKSEGIQTWQHRTRLTTGPGGQTTQRLFRWRPEHRLPPGPRPQPLRAHLHATTQHALFSDTVLLYSNSGKKLVSKCGVTKFTIIQPGRP
ncbi:uncharacterized protein LOC124509858 [Lynx rufus]|uniref:uncharacterized protein LOC124509858 n=1 Tax=Lynx rufus TaxID=61384 RepID=UPI001F124801|nr:uncharacterized protein LOC124509858 [Lynx rufus]